ncbi:MAG: hypothetical protein WCI02_03980 [Planctomycetota bacterium]
MRSIVRSIASVVFGFIAASMVMMIVEVINGMVLYPELGKAAAGVTDREVFRELFANVPIGALVVVILAWILGGIAGGFAAAWIAPPNKLLHAGILGGLLTLAGVANNLMIPKPIWFWVVSLMVFIPATLFGGYLTFQRKPARSS